MPLSVTFLGTATSVGVPMIGCRCPTCLSPDPRDLRSRCSIHVAAPDLSWAVDTGPDFRLQCLRENITHLDAVLYTHSHMDHITGFDELRRFTIPEDATIPIYGSHATLSDLERMFAFAFNGENRYPGYLKPDPIRFHGPFFLGHTKVIPLPVLHGKVETHGFLFEPPSGQSLAYIPDIKSLTPQSADLIRGTHTLIIDALRFRTHPTHLNFDEALEISRASGASRTFFTHFSCDVRHAEAEKILPPDVFLAYDGLKIFV